MKKYCRTSAVKVTSWPLRVSGSFAVGQLSFARRSRHRASSVVAEHVEHARAYGLANGSPARSARVLYRYAARKTLCGSQRDAAHRHDGAEACALVSIELRQYEQAACGVNRDG